MDIPGKLREDLKRIYGVIDPLDCVEDIVATESRNGTELVVRLRVPTRCEKYMPGPFFSKCSSYTLEQWAHEQARAFGVESGVPKAPEKKKDTVDFTKPERILFSGPKTIMFWPDGSKTMVSLGEGQEHDEYTAFCTAIVKKMFGATHKAKKFLDSVKVVQKKKEKKK